MVTRRAAPSLDRVRALRAEGLSWDECARVLGFSRNYLCKLLGPSPARIRTCAPHRAGVPVGCPPFFVAGCPQCEAKKARGEVTGDEPPPDLRGWNKPRKRIANFAQWRTKIAEGRKRELATRESVTWD